MYLVDINPKPAFRLQNICPNEKKHLSKRKLLPRTEAKSTSIPALQASCAQLAT